MFPTDPCYPVAQAIACPLALEVHRRFSLSQRLTQFRQGDILELTDSLSRNPKLLTHFFEGLRFATVQPEPLEDYFALVPLLGWQPLPFSLAAQFILTLRPAFLFVSNFLPASLLHAGSACR
jgi:hypothetical protein